MEKSDSLAAPWPLAMVPWCGVPPVALPVAPGLCRIGVCQRKAGGLRASVERACEAGRGGRLINIMQKNTIYSVANSVRH